MALASYNTMVGIGNTIEQLNALPGASGNSIAWNWDSGAIYFHAHPVNTSYVTASASDVVALALDFDNRRFWIRNITTNSGWNGDVTARQDPATGCGGHPFGTLAPGPYFIMVWVGNPAIT